MNIQPVNYNYQQNSNTTFKGGLKSLNTINPISHYADVYFNKAAKSSQRHMEPISELLANKIKLIKLNKGSETLISAWDINPDKSENYVLFLHGMAQNVSNYQPLYESILRRNTGIFAVEYRGYGINKTATISEDKLRDDVEQAYKYLTEKRNVKPENITVIGHSMGGALATNFASKHKDIRSLILVCPITNMKDVGKKFASNTTIGMGIPEKVNSLTEKLNPLKALYNLRFNSLSKIQEVESPTYIIQSQNDTVTLLGGARKLAKKALRKGILQDFTLLPLGGHKVDQKKVTRIAEILEEIYPNNN